MARPSTGCSIPHLTLFERVRSLRKIVCDPNHIDYAAVTGEGKGGTWVAIPTPRVISGPQEICRRVNFSPGGRGSHEMGPIAPAQV
jgi:hypothetical protein